MKKVTIGVFFLVVAIGFSFAGKTESEAKTAKIYIACDDHYILWLNGDQLGTGKYTPEKPDVYDVKLSEGDIIAISASDDDDGRRSAGLFCCITLPGDKKSLGTSKKWRCSVKKQKPGWQKNAKKIYAGSGMSEKNVHGELLTKAERYQSIDPLLKGSFVWTKKNKPIIYIKKFIAFKEFE